MPIPRNKSVLTRIFEEPFVYDVVIALAALVAAIYGGFNYFKTNKPEAVAIFWCAGVVFIVTCLKHIAAFKKASKKESLHELEGCLHTLHAALLPAGSILRITIHVPVEEGRRLEQVTNYVIDPADGKTAGRRFAVQSGVAGAAFRRNEMLAGERSADDHEKYILELISKWNYSEEDARKCNMGTKSWFAIPIPEPGNNQKVQGVIYFDSDQQKFFTDDRQILAMSAAVGIARFIDKRYSA